MCSLILIQMEAVLHGKGDLPGSSYVQCIRSWSTSPQATFSMQTYIAAGGESSRTLFGIQPLVPLPACCWVATVPNRCEREGRSEGRVADAARTGS